MNTFAVRGRCVADPPPADWRHQLAEKLGQRPRRIGVWAELGLYGALQCMANAGVSTLPEKVTILATSCHGPAFATQTVLEQVRDDLPMPLTFLQTQTSQMLAMLAAHLGWSGNACFITSHQPQNLLRLAAVQGRAHGVLAGWIEETGEGRSNWLWLHPCEVPGSLFAPAQPTEIFAPYVSHLCIGQDSIQVRMTSV